MHYYFYFISHNTHGTFVLIYGGRGNIYFTRAFVCAAARSPENVRYYQNQGLKGFRNI